MYPLRIAPSIIYKDCILNLRHSLLLSEAPSYCKQRHSYISVVVQVYL